MSVCCGRACKRASENRVVSKASIVSLFKAILIRVNEYYFCVKQAPISGGKACVKSKIQIIEQIEARYIAPRLQVIVDSVPN